MPLKIANLSIASAAAPAALAVLLMGAPAFAQSQSSSAGDPFSGVSAVDSDEMSAVGGELASEFDASMSVPIGTDNRAAGAQNGGGGPTNTIGTATRTVSASGNSSNFANQGSATVTITNNNYGAAGGNGGLQQ